MSDESIPYDEPEQIVCTGEEGSGVWNPAFGAWEADEFGMDSDQSVGPGERLFVNRRLYDALAAKLAEAESALAALTAYHSGEPSQPPKTGKDKAPLASREATP
jgi:hypothetical protein